MSASRLAIAVGLASIACSALAPMALAQATSTARIVSIAAGQNTSYAVDDAGHVWSWGLYSAWIDARAEGASLVPARGAGHRRRGLGERELPLGVRRAPKPSRHVLAILE